MTTEETKRQKT